MVHPSPPDVLVVEDSRTQALELKFVLDELGYGVGLCGDLAEAILALDESHWDIVLLDLMLPDASRLEALEALEARVTGVPIVILSALVDREVAMSALQLGAQDYLIKGQYSPDLLDRTIRYAIERKRITNELEELAEELAAKNAELEALNEQKNQMMGVIAHDLRNPLGVTHLYGQLLLRRKANLTESQEDYVNSILNSNRFMRQLVDDILDISKIESGKLSLTREPACLHELITRNIELNSVLAEDKEVNLQFEADEVPLVEIDGLKIQQVLNNLISNAIKFSHAGSTVDVSLRRLEGEVEVAVQDEGVGIPADYLSELFQPFSVVSRPGTGGERGSGLGLAIARKIIEGHGGRLWAESEVGVGSTFTFRIPLDDEG